ncbi:DUF1217 domain-containing protein [Cognatishimia sp. MH4019]|uniref:DUF1217 domain-containing protein n=1 Tax=Cognatishimia sp. MH4019 TaxID=2854030 RepID=UPI001CD7B645|nr:DUF1217 domain-containing protein [Cognatishimia sp. MH4019]
MSFQPVLPLSGLAGWNFLNRTMETQREVFENSPSVKRDVDYFQEKIGDVTSAKELVADRRLLNVALGAFGLEGDIGNKYFVQKILEDGTSDPEALGNKLADKRYLALSEAFGFGDNAVPLNQADGFAKEIVDQFHSRQFEVAVGAQDDDLRLALNLDRDLSDIVAQSSSENTKWFSIMGNPPLRQVFETALNMPTGSTQLDLDQQLSLFKDSAERLFGSSDPAIFASEDTRDDLVETFLLRSQIAQGQSFQSSTSIALTLLSNL